MDLFAQLNLTLREIRRRGCVVREEWLAEGEGGLCEIRGRLIFFSNIALPLPERLQHAKSALRTLEKRDPLWD
ncbi:MAG: hypothetical protein Q4D38_07230 [Planctomycetia bacterium]|nr:hypothetical protein [Planctomycetia bacterium]